MPKTEVTKHSPSKAYLRARNLALFLLVCILVAGVAYLMIQYQRDYQAMNNMLEGMR